MFHTYVLNGRSVPIDIDRARFLADTALWNDVVDRCNAAGNTDPQEVWDSYVSAHYDKYGEIFPPQAREEPF